MMHQQSTRSSTDSSDKSSSNSRQRLKVLYDFEYETRGKRVKIVKDEQLVLVRKTNDDWWQVVRTTDLAGSYYVPEQATFYVPTGYVAQLQPRAEGTRFYVDDDKMFKASEQQLSAGEASQPPLPRKHSSDSFKSKVIRKLSGNLAQPSEAPARAQVKHWDGSAFGMCFGRDNRTEAQLNPFQEELEHALSNRLSQRKGSARQLGPPPSESDLDAKPKEDKAQKASWSCQRLRKADDAKRAVAAQQHHALPTIAESRLRDASTATPARQHCAVASAAPPADGPKDIEERALDIINDKRKMWAIETLMSELMLQSCGGGRPLAVEPVNEAASGPDKLAQELHDMSVSRRLESAQPQADGQFDFRPRSRTSGNGGGVARSPKLLDEYNEANILNEAALDGISSTTTTMTTTTTTTATATTTTTTPPPPGFECPSYSSVSLRSRRHCGAMPCIRCKPSDFGDELQLSPSLEKLASEIKFLPATAAKCSDSEEASTALDWHQTTTISQDSLRLYKRRSKSEPQLLIAQTQRCHLQQPKPERKYTQYEHQRHGARASQQCTEPQPASTHHNHHHHHHHHHYHQPSSSSSKYKLQRKSRSLSDLDCSEMDEREQLELRRRYKPVPKLRSKDSFKRLLLLHKSNAPSMGSSGNAKPVPAKRRVHQQQQQQQQPQQQPQHTPHSSYDDLDQVDIERSTAVGFKRLLRASDSGSEECLQSKTFPSLPSLLLLNRAHQHLNEQQSASNDNLNNLSSSRSLSSETILSSASASSASARILDEPELDNLVDLPPGWRQIYDANAKRFCFVSDRGDKWFSSNDAEGKIYFFEENSNESSWALPAIANENRARTISNGDWPQLFDGNMCVLKEGLINKTKITTENGKKLRKAWSLSYAVLTELFLLFFKDAKTFAAMKMDQFAAAKPDITVDLNGAFIEPADKLSNRKNVYLINTLLGLQVLMQSDNALAITEWYKEINDAIRKLPFSQECRRSASSK